MPHYWGFYDRDTNMAILTAMEQMVPKDLIEQIDSIDLMEQMVPKEQMERMVPKEQIARYTGAWSNNVTR